MITGILVALLVVAVAYGIHVTIDRNNVRSISNGLYQSALLPKAARVVSLPRCETPEYKLEQALRRGGRLEERMERLEHENCELAAQKQLLINQNARLESSYGALERDYRRQFGDARALGYEAAAMLAENARLRLLLAQKEDALARAVRKLARYEADPHNLVH